MNERTFLALQQRQMRSRRPSVPKLGAVIYCRVSTQDQSDYGNSLDNQLKHCRAYCADLGLNIVAEFSEAASAKTTKTLLNSKRCYPSADSDTGKLGF